MVLQHAHIVSYPTNTRAGNLKSAIDAGNVGALKSFARQGDGGCSGGEVEILHTLLLHPAECDNRHASGIISD